MDEEITDRTMQRVGAENSQENQDGADGDAIVNRDDDEVIFSVHNASFTSELNITLLPTTRLLSFLCTLSRIN